MMEDDTLMMTSNEVCEYAKISEEQLWQQIHHLLLEKEVRDLDINFNPAYIIEAEGTKTFFDRKYITNGKKEWRDNFYDRLKIISTLVALILGIVSFIISFTITIQNKTEIEKLKIEIQSIKKLDSAK